MLVRSPRRRSRTPRLELLESRQLLAADLLITEFMASNGNTLADEDGNFSDWLEIHNEGATPASLDGWTLTDDAGNLQKWAFPAVELDPGAYSIVFASGKDRADVAGELHTNFKLSAGGEYVALVSPAGIAVSEYGPHGTDYPPQSRDISYGLTPAGARFFTEPTPGADNVDGVLGFVADTTASVERGFFAAPFQVELSTPTADATIRYTVDGTRPTETTGVVYSDPITISGTTTLRAAAFKADFLPSAVATDSYIFPNDVLKQNEALGKDGRGVTPFAPWGHPGKAGSHQGTSGGIWLNDGGGGFADKGRNLGDSTSQAVVVGDFDGDSDLDAFFANSGANRVWLNNGAGFFVETGQGVGDADSRALDLGDLDGDGDLDVFVVNAGANTIWLNDGTGHFTDSGQRPGADGLAVALGDLDGDGDLDALVGNAGANQIWLNDGAGNFAQDSQGLGTAETHAVALGDLDGDGDLDAFLGDIGGNSVWVNDGAGTFTKSAQDLGNARSFAVALGDFDGDGDLDAFVGNFTGDRVWLNDGTGSFVDSGQSLGDAVSRSVALGDTDGDGDLDALVANAGANTANTFWVNDGTGHFTADSSQDVGKNGFGVALAKLDANGSLDALVVNSGPNKVWLNSPVATFIDSGQSLGDAESQAVALGDLDGDADLDAFVANAGANAVWVNDAGGHFTDSGQSLGAAESRTVTLGDVDRDGDLDAFVTNAGANTLWLNDGTGQFTDSGQGLGTAAVGATLGDVDGDGDLDAFVVNATDNKVWRNNGDGTFTDSGQSLGNSASRDVALGDVDGDNDLDAFVVNADTNALWLNDGTGVFTDSGQSLGTKGVAVALGDVDRDGDLDAFLANSRANKVWLNDGTGVFTDSGKSLGRSPSRDVALVDTDGDGDLDAFVANSRTNRVWLNNARGNFADSKQRPGSGGIAVALGDLNGDGDLLEVFIANSGANTVWRNKRLTKFHNSDVFFGDLTARAIQLGDLDADGDLDAFIGRVGDKPDNGVLLNNGSGSFSDTSSNDSSQRLGDSVTYAVALGDLDGDNDLDAFVGNFAGDKVWLNDGKAKFTDSGQSLGDSSTLAVALGDVDGDGDLDALVAHADSSRLWLNDGTGQFTDSGLALGTGGLAALLGDLDGDGDLDALIGSSGANTVWLNDGLGTFADSGQRLGDARSRAVALGDLNGDGRLDVFAGNASPRSVWLNGTTGPAGTFTNTGQALGDSVAWNVTLIDVDGDGDLDAFVGEALGNNVWLNDGAGNFTRSGQEFGNTSSSALALGDVDGDGDIDAITANSWSNVDWEVDPEIINNPVPENRFTVDDLRSLPTISLVLPWDDMFGDGGQGIYIQGETDPRAVSVEQILPDGSTGFQIDASVQIQGNSSTQRWKVDKLSMRLKFREEFGPTKLNYPLFGAEATDRFDTVVLDAVHNYSWSHADSLQSDRAKYIQDQYVANLHNAMGGLSPHAKYHNLFINGVYWGTYYVHERPDGSFAAAYFGGDKDDYDVIRHDPLRTINPNRENYLAMLDLARQDLSDDTNYRNLENVLDVDELIDYVLANFYTGNSDWAADNWYATFNHASPDGKWRFHSWDAEETLTDVNDSTTVNIFNPRAPTEIHQRLTANAEYRLRFADHVQKHLFNGGPLTPENAAAEYRKLMDEVDRGIAGESARWGDNRREPPYTHQEWLDTQQQLLDNFFPQRTAILLDQLRALDLYPAIESPTFNQHGGDISESFDIRLSAPAGTIYYTIDGSDPRLPGGGISTSAIEYTGAFHVAQPTTVRARAAEAGQWSALNEADFIVMSDLPLRITEINFDPHAANPVPGLGEQAVDKDQFEFLELANVGSQSIDLAGSRLVETDVAGASQGIVFEFAAQTLEAGARTVVVRNRGAFQSRYGTAVPIADGNDGSGGADGQFGGKLANGGERITLLDAGGAVIQRFDYGTNDPWPQRTIAGGSSLEIVDPAGDYGDPRNWRPSSEFGGSPGLVGQGADERIVINEVMARPELPAEDQVELANTTASPIDIAHWYMSDSAADYFKFQVPAPTVVPAGGYQVFGATQLGFGLSSLGETLWLLEADASGRPVRFVDSVAFAASAPGVALGRWPDGDPLATLYPMSEPSFGAANPGPTTGDAIVSEVHYDAPRRVVSTDFEDAATNPFSPQRGTWTVTGGRYQVVPGGEGDTLSLLPSFIPLGEQRISATANMPADSGFPENAAVIFDYHGATDFKFVAVDVTANAWTIGQRDIVGWNVLAKASGSPTLTSGTDMDITVEIRGPYVTVKSGGVVVLRHQFETGVGRGLVGLGSNNGQAVFDDVTVQPLRNPRDFEFVEIHNTTQNQIMLAGWRLAGAVQLDFADGTTLDAGKTLVAVGFDPTLALLADDFRLVHGIDPTVRLVGPYAGELSDHGATVTLLKPVGQGGSASGLALVDRVVYDDQSPWPEAAAGTGQSLNRTDPDAFGAFATSWAAAEPTPGSVLSVTAGDMNGDGRVDGADVVPFVTALANAAAYEAVYGMPATRAGDIDGDGDLDVDDIDDFVALFQAGAGSRTVVTAAARPAAVAPAARTRSLVAPIHRPTRATGRAVVRAREDFRAREDWNELADRAFETETVWRRLRARRGRRIQTSPADHYARHPVTAGRHDVPAKKVSSPIGSRPGDPGL